MREQLCAVRLAQDTAAGRRLRDHAFIYADEEQHADVHEAAPLHVADQDTVAPGRNHRHPRLAEARFDERAKIPHRHLLVTEYLRELVEEAVDVRPDLRVLAREFAAPLRLEVLPARRQLLLRPARDTERAQRLRLLAHGPAALCERLRERVEKRENLLAQRIQLHDLRRVLADVDPRKWLPPRVLPPNPAGDHVVFQLVHRGAVEVRDTALQHAEHAAVRIILRARLERGAQVFHKRIGRERPLLVDEKRDVVTAEPLAHVAAVGGKVTAHHRKVAVAEPLRAHHAADLIRDESDLSARRAGAEDADIGGGLSGRAGGLRCPVGDNACLCGLVDDLHCPAGNVCRPAAACCSSTSAAVAKQPLLQLLQLRGSAVAAACAIFDVNRLHRLHTRFFCHFLQLLHHPAAEREEIRLPVGGERINARIHRHRHIDIADKRQQLLKELHLQRRETRETIQHQHRAADQLRFLRQMAQPLRQLLRGHVAARKPLAKAAVDQFDIAQFS